MKYYVYILYPEKCDRYYVGQSEDLERRYDEHNSGKGGKYTKSCKPWKLVYSEIYEGRSLAVQREIEIKRKKSRKYIEKLLESVKPNGISSAD